MAQDIIARGMASKAESKAQQAIDELSMVVEGRMNAEGTVFTDLNGDVVVPDTETVYQDVDTYVYYRYNGSAYYIVSDPRNTVRYTVQTVTEEEQAQARQNIGAQEALESGVNIKTINSSSILEGGNLDLVDLSSDQTITGVKTIKNYFTMLSADDAYTIYIKNSGWNNLDIGFNSNTDHYRLTNTYLRGAGRDLGTSSGKWKDLYLSGNAYIDGFIDGPASLTLKLNGNNKYYFNPAQLLPANDNELDLGSSSKRIKDLYSSGTSYLEDGKVQFGNSQASGTAKWVLEEDAYGRFTISRIYNNNKVVYWTFDGNTLSPESDNTNKIGSRTKKLAELFVELLNKNANNFGLTLPDTSGYAENKEIATTDQTFNVINASDIVNNTLTQAQYDLVTNGKPTLIKGTFLGFVNPMLFGTTVASGAGYSYGLIVGQTSTGWQSLQTNIKQYKLNNSTLVMTVESNDKRIVIENLSNIVTDGINGKTIPGYPSSPTTDKVLTYGTDNTLKWGDGIFNVINASDIVNNTLTQDQYDLITNGKPTLISGTYLGYKNMLITYWFEYSTSWRALAIAQRTVFSVKLNTQSMVLEIGGDDLVFNKVAQINGKIIPAYPTLSSGDIYKQLIYKDDNTMAWGDITPNANQNITDEYDSTSTYDVGDLVIHNNKLYRCSTAITTAEDWDSSHWTETNIKSEFGLLKSTNTWSATNTYLGTDAINVKYESTSSNRLRISPDSNGNNVKFVWNNDTVITLSNYLYLYNIAGSNQDLGKSWSKFKDLYLSGKLTDGTNEASIKDLIGNIVELKTDFSNAQSGAWTLITDQDDDNSLNTLQTLTVPEKIAKHLTFFLSHATINAYCMPLVYTAEAYSLYYGTEKASTPLIIQYMSNGVGSDPAGWYYLKR